MSEQSEKFDSWGIVEVMGHKKFAGHITEQVIAGSALIRVDVPAVTTRDGKPFNEFSKLIGVGSIYCITPTTEEVARKAAMELAGYGVVLPVYIPEERQIPAVVPTGADEDEQDLWDADDDREPGL